MLRFKLGQRVVVSSFGGDKLRHGRLIGWPEPGKGKWKVKLDSAKRPQWIHDDWLRAETEANAKQMWKGN